MWPVWRRVGISAVPPNGGRGWRMAGVGGGSRMGARWRAEPRSTALNRPQRRPAAPRLTCPTRVSAGQRRHGVLVHTRGVNGAVLTSTALKAAWWGSTCSLAKWPDVVADRPHSHSEPVVRRGISARRLCAARGCDDRALLGYENGTEAGVSSRHRRLCLRQGGSHPLLICHGCRIGGTPLGGGACS
jgi:hypothetical protein